MKQWLAALFAFLPLGAQATITPNIVTNLTSGPSPLAVSFDATGSSHSDGSINTNRFSDLLYLWDYGDTASGIWTPTGNSRNQMSGALGAHVFEPTSFPDCGGTCKVFSVSLTIRDAAGDQATTSISITVYDPESTGANGWGDSGETVCISTSGNFTGCPASGSNITSGASFQSLLTTHVGAGGRRILFRGGETWQFSGTYTLTANGPGMIGSYGGSKTVINLTVASPLLLLGDYWRIQDFQFTGSAVDTIVSSPSGMTDGVRDLLVQRTLTSDGAFSQLWVWTNPSFAQGTTDNNMHRHIFVVDNNWGSLAGGGGYHMFTEGWGYYILGNQFGSARIGTHSIRINTGEEVLISNNRLGPSAEGKNVVNLRDIPNACPECPGRPFCGRVTREYIVQDNDFLSAGSASVGGVLRSCGEPQFEGSDISEEDYIVERNLIRPPGGITDGFGISIDFVNVVNQPRITIRNNIVDMTGYNWTSGVKVSGQGTKVFNNTCYRTDNVGAGGSNTSCVTGWLLGAVFNNVLYAPNWTGAITVFDELSPAMGKGNNLSNAPGGISSNPFQSSSPTTRQDFTPALGSQLVNAGALLGGPQDALGLCRSGVYDVGAVERGAQSCFSGVPPLPQCADGVDNDGDTYVDYLNDPGCVSAVDNSELDPAQCSDAIDNDNDLLIDYPTDPGCVSVADNDEFDIVANAQISGEASFSGEARLETADADHDGVASDLDNCQIVANVSQQDADLDGYGNFCDPDFDDNGIVGGSDFNTMRLCFGIAVPSVGGPPNDPTCAESDMDGNGVVGGSDFNTLRTYFGFQPGPSCCGFSPAAATGEAAPPEGSEGRWSWPFDTNWPGQ